MKSIATRLLVLVLDILLLAAAIFGMLFWQRRDVSALLETTHVRPLGAGELSPEAERVPLVAALWDEALYMELVVDYYSNWGEADPGDLLQQAYTGLAQSGVLPQSSCVAQRAASLKEEQHYAVQTGAFSTYDSLKLYKDGPAVQAIVPVVDTEYFDLDKALQSYLVYLGLDVLDDWQPATTFVATGVYAAEAYSPGAQLLVQLVRDSGYGYRCGVYTMERAEFARRNIFEE